MIRVEMGGYATAGEVGRQEAFSKISGTTFCLLYAQSTSALRFLAHDAGNIHIKPSYSFENVRKTEYEREKSRLYRESEETI